MGDYRPTKLHNLKEALTKLMMKRSCKNVPLSITGHSSVEVGKQSTVEARKLEYNRPLIPKQKQEATQPA